ncbi:beta-galactosidase [Talaromyces proteolyticus]|uniref:Beta-galactosidase n=1 Tax=Talaromyces proteolyticus TaxID=1131652 RepID=A0AAD4PSH9_9EURO|nr:beta-galactosidase [Talaromyces proteolyticus]KAH8688981.1 beta-galactosidase [Talaromyces proteolyticus]
MLLSGEFHPWRLPVPSLWLDIFQKIKALGFSATSFYVHWALLEGEPGVYRADGAFDLAPFFEAAAEAGIYLLARPGPYIQAESFGGGFPGWIERMTGSLRTNDSGFLDSFHTYYSNTTSVISKFQISNGGPVILLQPENEYSVSQSDFEPTYMQYIMDEARSNGIVVPFISNDAGPYGNDAPGSGVGAVDVYGHDYYPLGFSCSNPDNWTAFTFPDNFYQLHESQSPTTPYSLVEFQGGSMDGWGGSGFDGCAQMVGTEAERLWYKNNVAAGASFFSIYMIYGGTNWGNVGYPNGYTSYDYGAAITEARTVDRDKYSELKLLGNFLKVSPTYLDVQPSNNTISVANTTDISVSPLTGRTSNSSFWVIRHSDYTSTDNTSYTITFPTSNGTVNLPQLGGALSLLGRDSKILVTDYPLGNINLLYSTAELFTWKEFSEYTVVVLYGDIGEHEELAIGLSNPNITVLEGDSSTIRYQYAGNQTILSWDITGSRLLVKAGNIYFFLLDRSSAYNFWVPQLVTSETTHNYTSDTTVASSIVLSAGYMVRTARLQGDELHIAADFNATTTVEIFGAPASANSLYINGQKQQFTKDSQGFWTTTVIFEMPNFILPDLTQLHWFSIDSLPELQSSYNDSGWTDAILSSTSNVDYGLSTPKSLFSSDYGYHVGFLLYRGYFTANGQETQLNLTTQGGSVFETAVWINDTFVGSYQQNSPYLLSLPTLQSGSTYVITIVIETLGIEEGSRAPRGVIDYSLDGGHSQSDISWKLTGNLGGEQYIDLARGPLNEGGLYAERQGLHLPSPPVNDSTYSWGNSTPFNGIESAGIGFWTAQLPLDLPSGYDIPLSFQFDEGSISGGEYRAQLYVNGFQFGKYAPSVGPQTTFPVPQGILNYNGDNWLAISIFAYNSSGGCLNTLKLVNNTVAISPIVVELADQPVYTKRANAY